MYRLIMGWACNIISSRQVNMKRILWFMYVMFSSPSTPPLPLCCACACACAGLGCLPACLPASHIIPIAWYIHSVSVLVSQSLLSWLCTYMYIHTYTVYICEWHRERYVFNKEDANLRLSSCMKKRERERERAQHKKKNRTHALSLSLSLSLITSYTQLCRTHFRCFFGSFK